MDNVYLITCGELNKRYFLSKFIKITKKILVVYENQYKKQNFASQLFKEGHHFYFNKKQLNLFKKENIEYVDLDNYNNNGIETETETEKYDLIILYNMQSHDDLLKLKEKFKFINLIILQNMKKFNPSQHVISKKLGLSKDKIVRFDGTDMSNFLLYRPKKSSKFRKLTKHQIFTIINREIRLNKINLK